MESLMNPVKLQTAIAALIQDQENNRAPINSVVETIFSLATRETFHKLSAKEKNALVNFYSAISQSDFSTRPQLAKLFPTFEKVVLAGKSNARFPILRGFTGEISGALEFLSPIDLFKAASCSPEFSDFSTQEIIRRLNQGEPVFSLGREKNELGKEALLSFLSKHGNGIQKLSLEGMKDLRANDMQNFIKKCPNLTTFSLKDCGLHFSQKFYLSFLSKHGNKMQKISLDGMKNLKINDIQKFFDLCPNLTGFFLKNYQLQFNKEAIFAFLSKHGNKIQKLSLNTMKNLSADEIQNFIELCPNLKALFLRCCNLNADMTADILRALSKTKVSHLDLSQNNIAVIPAEIGDLLELQELDLSSNKITNIPIELGNLSKLQKLDLNRNRIEEVSSGIGNLLQLQELHLGNNFITILSPELWNLSKLQKLDISDNQIEEISSGIENLLQLKQLYLNYNKITIILPELWNLSKLQKLDISDNQIEEIPPGIEKLLQLKQLDLSCNGIKILSSKLWNLSKLQKLDISDNQIKKIPQGIVKLKELKSFIFYDNYLPHPETTKKKLKEVLPTCFICSPSKKSESDLGSRIKVFFIHEMAIPKKLILKMITL
jgi:Leucine-rich repeat (LRR) protein